MLNMSGKLLPCNLDFVFITLVYANMHNMQNMWGGGHLPLVFVFEF